MIVLDASAVLAHFNDEPGSARAEEAYPGGVMSAANWAEVVGKVVDRGASAADAVRALSDAGVIVEPVTVQDAEFAGRLRRFAWARPLSLGDRLCLALASRLGASVLTADRAWEDVTLPGVEIELLR